MFYQLLAEILASLSKGPPNNKAKCIPGGTLRVLAGKNSSLDFILTNKHILSMLVTRPPAFNFHN
jgi:hypothetical protein